MNPENKQGKVESVIQVFVRKYNGEEAPNFVLLPIISCTLLTAVGWKLVPYERETM